MAIAEIRERRQREKPRERRADQAGEDDARFGEHGHRTAHHDGPVAVALQQRVRRARARLADEAARQTRRAGAERVAEQARHHHARPDDDARRARTPAARRRPSTRCSTARAGRRRARAGRRSTTTPATPPCRSRVIRAAKALNSVSNRKKGTRTSPMSTTQMIAQRMSRKRIKPPRRLCTDVELARLVFAII